MGMCLKGWVSFRLRYTYDEMITTFPLGTSSENQRK